MKIEDDRMLTSSSMLSNMASASKERCLEQETPVCATDSYAKSAKPFGGYVTYMGNAGSKSVYISECMTIENQIFEESEFIMNSYYKGIITRERVVDNLKKDCSRLYEHYKNTASEEETDIDLWEKAIAKVYHKYASHSVSEAIQVSAIQGREMCDAIYGSQRHIFVYFDSDNYKQCNEMKNLLLESANTLAEEKTGHKVDYSKQYMKDGGFNWNHDYYDLWNHKYGGLCELIGHHGMPPDNFSMLLYEPVMYEDRLIADVYITIDGEQYVWKQSLEEAYTEESADGKRTVWAMWKQSCYSLLDALDKDKMDLVGEFCQYFQFRR